MWDQHVQPPPWLNELVPSRRAKSLTMCADGAAPGRNPGLPSCSRGKSTDLFSEGLRLTAFTVGSGLPPRCTTPALHAMALAIIYQRGVTNVRGWVHRQPPWVAPVIHCSSTVEPTVIGHARTSDAATSSAAASGPDHQVLATIARLRKKWTSTSHV